MSMREYAKLAPTFWTGKTGRALKRRGSDAVIVALYLVSSPHSNMLGLYYQPILYLAEETGLTIDGASKGLQACIECSFCSYDHESKVVWVHEMAAWQIADELSSADKRCKGIQKDYDALPDNPFLGQFFDRYQAAFHLSRRREYEGDDEPECEGASQAPSKPHRSQEQEQEQEQESLKPLAKGHGRPGEEDRPMTVDDLVAEGIPKQVAADWLKVRKAKKAPLTRTAWDAVKREAEEAKLTPAQAVKHAAEASWQGFKASWFARDAATQKAGSSQADVFDGVH